MRCSDAITASWRSQGHQMSQSGALPRAKSSVIGWQVCASLGGVFAVLSQASGVLLQVIRHSDQSTQFMALHAGRYLLNWKITQHLGKFTFMLTLPITQGSYQA